MRGPGTENWKDIFFYKFFITILIILVSHALVRYLEGLCPLNVEENGSKDRKMEVIKGELNPELD